MNRHRFSCHLMIALTACGLALAGSALAAQAGLMDAPMMAPSDNVDRNPVAGQRAPDARTVKIGLIVPLTGRSAELGTAMQDAATVALFDRYARLPPQAAKVRVDLMPKDTGDTPEQASKAITDALDNGAAFIIGPVFSESTAATAPIALKHKISMISFSNDVSQAKPGVYIYGFSPQEQAARVVTFALHKDRTKIAALVPDSALGNSVAAAADAALRVQGSKLMTIAKYAPQGVGIDKAITDLITNAPGFNALLLVEGGPALSTILGSLDAHHIQQPQVQLLGTGIWDDSALIRKVNLEGAWLASSPPESTALFEKRFVATYGYEPPRVASLAYDAVSLAVTLATSGKDLDGATLTNPIGFTGPGNGNFRLHEDGTVERSLAVLRVTGPGYTVIDVAPSSFTPIAASPSTH